jgi:hypothetical protein
MININMLSLSKLKNEPISALQILQALDFKAKILSYRELIKLSNLDDILGDHRACVILYEWKSNFGHWVCCFERPNGNIEFFDSLGYFPDDELNFISKSYKTKNNLCYPYLINILYNSQKQIEYNDHKLQQDKSSTCGRWCIARIIMRDIDIDKFANIFKIKNYIPDDIITMITYDV